MDRLFDLTQGNWSTLAVAAGMVLAFILFRRLVFFLAAWLTGRYGG
ncbi:hypothetical protein [Peptococcus simiae]